MLTLRGAVLSPDGRRRIVATHTGPAETPLAVGQELAAMLLAEGAGELLPPGPLTRRAESPRLVRDSDMTSPVVELRRDRHARQSSSRDLTWTLRDGEAWAVVGPTGSGKTTLAEVILGKHHAHGGDVRWPLSIGFGTRAERSITRRR